MWNSIFSWNYIYFLRLKSCNNLRMLIFYIFWLRAPRWNMGSFLEIPFSSFYDRNSIFVVKIGLSNCQIYWWFLKVNFKYFKKPFSKYNNFYDMHDTNLPTRKDAKLCECFFGTYSTKKMLGSHTYVLQR